MKKLGRSELDVEELEFSYEKLITNPKTRERFFRLYDLIILDSIRDGDMKSAQIHAQNRKRIAGDIATFGIKVPDLALVG